MITDYKALNLEVIDALKSNHLSQSFSWLNKLILYLPMWVRSHPNSTARSVCLSWIVLLIIILGLIYHFTIVMYQYVYFSTDGFVYQSVVSAYEVLYALSRVLAIY